MKAEIETRITDQCALFSRPDEDDRVDMLVSAGDKVAQGAPVLRSRRHPELVQVAPAAGQVAAVELGPGRRLSHVTIFHEPAAGRFTHDVAAARAGGDAAALRAVLLSAGLWPQFRSRPFGRVPPPAEQPSAIFVMALDTRPDAPPPRLALAGREEELARGLRALSDLTDGPVFAFQDRGAEIPGLAGGGERCRVAKVGAAHPHGLAGVQIAARHPAGIGRAVWDIHAEDVAGIGAFLETGLVPEARLVGVAGPALRETRLVRCQPGADLRALCFDILKPGSQRLLSGSLLDGVEGRWLGRWHRQVSALASSSREPYRHWFSAALRQAGRPLPLIPTAALERAFGGVLPAVPLLRALASNDAETAVRLGALSLVEEDVAQADYASAAAPRLSAMLRAMLDRIAVEDAA